MRRKILLGLLILIGVFTLFVLAEYFAMQQKEGKTIKSKVTPVGSGR